MKRIASILAFVFLIAGSTGVAADEHGDWTVVTDESFCDVLALVQVFVVKDFDIQDTLEESCVAFLKVNLLDDEIWVPVSLLPEETEYEDLLDQRFFAALDAALDDKASA